LLVKTIFEKHWYVLGVKIMSFYTSLTGINAALNRLDAASNNLANSQTDTFKRSSVTFQDVYAFQPQQMRSTVPGQGASLAAVSQQFSQGSLLSTGNTLDVAISGDGFYVMQDSNGKKFYSREGKFDLDKSGNMVNADGDRLMGAKGIVSPNNKNYSLETVKIQPQTTGQSKPTTEINIGINLPSNDSVINLPFDPLNEKTYSKKNIVEIYDSTGKPHDANIYYVKKSNPTEGNPRTTWETHLYIDGKRIDQPAKEPIITNSKSYMEWTGDGFSSEKFQWPIVDTPNNVAGAISFVGDKVYQGNGSSAKLVGMIDPKYNGVNGKSLRINYVDQIKPINEVIQNGVGLQMNSGLRPIGFLPAGSENIKITIDSFGADDDIQLFTEGGKHLLGTPITDEDSDITWIKNEISTIDDVNLAVIKEEFGFSYGANYDGEDPLIVSPKSFPYNIDTTPLKIESVNGMKIKYTGDGDRSNTEAVVNDGNVQGTIEIVTIDKVSEPVFLMVSGSGVFGVMVSWDKMPDSTSPSINHDAIKGKIKYIAGSGIEFPIDGSSIIAGDPKVYSEIYLDDGTFIPDLRIKFEKSTGYGIGYKQINLSQNGKPEGELSSVDIDKSGIVKANYTNGYVENVSTLILAKFNNPQGLRQLGDTKYLDTALSGGSFSNRAGYGGMGLLQTGAIEQSNVDVTTELVDLIEAQRNFQSNSKAIETIDKMVKTMSDNIS
jgi:flagellar hook protein FlgE